MASRGRYGEILDRFEVMRLSSPVEASGLTPTQFQELPIFSGDEEEAERNPPLKITRFPGFGNREAPNRQAPSVQSGGSLSADHAQLPPLVNLKGEEEEYSTEIINNLRQKEREQQLTPEVYALMKKKLKDRQYQLLIDWLYDVQISKSVKIEDETLFATFSCIIRCFGNESFSDLPPDKYQLLGIACLRLMMKVYQRYEILEYAIYICDKSYTRRQMNDMELKILSVIGFVSEIITVYTWMQLLSSYIEAYELVARYNAKIQNYPELLCIYLPSQLLCGLIFSVSEEIPEVILTFTGCTLDDAVIVGAQIDSQKAPAYRSYQTLH